jgi:hypothetical protein
MSDELEQLQETAGYWFAQYIELVRATTGDDSLQPEHATADDIKGTPHDTYRMLAAQQRDKANARAQIRAAVMQRQGHILNRQSWEMELLNEIQQILQLKVLH